MRSISTKLPAAVKWKFDPKPDTSSQGVACCDLVNRGVAFADGRVFVNTLDAQTIALDAATGRELWRTKLGDIRQGETITMAPLVVKGKVLVGNSGGELGVRGWLTALDATTGRIVWRAWSTGPDKDVLIGASFKPFYAQDRGTDLGVSSWPGSAWKIGGGNVWGFLSYDPELDLIFYGTGNPGPWNPEQRPGANKWTSGIFARRPDTGEAVWYYQWSPHDLHDYDGVNENILVDLPIGGRQRRVHRSRRSQRLPLCPRPLDRAGALGRSLRADHDLDRRRSADRCPALEPGQGPARRRDGAQHLSGLPGRQGLAAHGLVAAHRAALHPAPEPVPGRRDLPGELHRRHALRRRGHEDQCRRRWPSR